MDLTIVAGQTRYLDFVIKNDGATFDACTMGVSGILRDANGAVTLLSSGTVVTWLYASCSQIRLAPSSCHFDPVLSPYSLRFRVIDLAGRINYYPSAVEFNITAQSQ
jgi:hypothetical protein